LGEAYVSKPALLNRRIASLVPHATRYFLNIEVANYMYVIIGID